MAQECFYLEEGSRSFEDKKALPECLTRESRVGDAEGLLWVGDPGLESLELERELRPLLGRSSCLPKNGLGPGVFLGESIRNFTEQRRRYFLRESASRSGEGWNIALGLHF